MTERERLIQEYENAYFAVIMHDLAEYEGQQLTDENDKLKDDSTLRIPEDIKKHSLSRIRRAFKKEKIFSAFKHSKRLVSIVAVIFLILSILFAAAYAAVPEFRACTLNVLIEVSNLATKLTMVPENENLINSSVDKTISLPDSIIGYKMPTIPEGFEVKMVKIADDWGATAILENSPDQYIRIRVVKGPDANFQVDTENASRLEVLLINDYCGYLIEKAGNLRVIFADNINGYFVSIESSTLDENTIISMLNEMDKIYE